MIKVKFVLIFIITVLLTSSFLLIIKISFLASDSVDDSIESTTQISLNTEKSTAAYVRCLLSIIWFTIIIFFQNYLILIIFKHRRNEYNGSIMKISAAQLQLGDILRDSNFNYCKISKIIREIEKGKLLIVCGKETHHLDQNYALVIRRRIWFDLLDEVRLIKWTYAREFDQNVVAIEKCNQIMI